jgi:hypothetical protein
MAPFRPFIKNGDDGRISIRKGKTWPVFQPCPRFHVRYFPRDAYE